MADEVRLSTRRDCAALGLCLLALAGCSSTRLVSSWGASDVGTISFRKVLVICITRSPATRRSAEDALAGQFKRAQATPSYSILSEQDVMDEAKVRAAIADAGFDGTVTMRLVAATKEYTHVPGAHPSHYNRFGSYYHRGWSGAYNPGYTRVDDIVKIETNVYSTRDDKLVWAGTSETFNPTSVETVVAEIARAVAKDLRKRKLIPTEGK
jgi:hypothetical protein